MSAPVNIDALAVAFFRDDDVREAMASLLPVFRKRGADAVAKVEAYALDCLDRRDRAKLLRARLEQAREREAAAFETKHQTSELFDLDIADASEYARTILAAKFAAEVRRLIQRRQPNEGVA
jgi:hypothetical protein